MLKFFSKKHKQENEKNATSSPQDNNSSQNSQGLFARLAEGLKNTREHFINKLSNLISGKKIIDATILTELETYLLTADVGVAATNKIISDLTAQVQRKDLTNTAELIKALKQELIAIIAPCQQNIIIPKNNANAPFVMLMVGVNGVGKTTTIGKIAKKLQTQGHKVMLAAGDTFRAAAIEQLKTWGERNDVPVISQQHGADSASVIYGAITAAKARGYDVVIADTAGRLHTQANLMAELAKITKVMKKIDSTAPHETMLILDAAIGQNALTQAKKFHEAINLSSITITKLDGTAKGGIIFAIANEFKLPIRYIGIGEKLDDLEDFNAQEFVEALFK